MNDCIFLQGLGLIAQSYYVLVCSATDDSRKLGLMLSITNAGSLQLFQVIFCREHFSEEPFADSFL